MMRVLTRSSPKRQCRSTHHLDGQAAPLGTPYATGVHVELGRGKATVDPWKVIWGTGAETIYATQISIPVAKPGASLYYVNLLLAGFRGYITHYIYSADCKYATPPAL